MGAQGWMPDLALEPSCVDGSEGIGFWFLEQRDWLPDLLGLALWVLAHGVCVSFSTCLGVVGATKRIHETWGVEFAFVMVTLSVRTSNGA